MAVSTAASPTKKRSASFGGRARWAGRLRVTVGVVLSFYIVFLLNLIVFRHPVRFDLTAESTHTLSPGTRKQLELIGEEIRVLIPRYNQIQNPAHAAERRVLDRARRLLEEYMVAQPRIRIVAEVDVLREPEEWTSVRTRYGLTANQVNRFVFLAGPANEYRQTVMPRDLATFKESPDPRVMEPEVVAYRAEKALTDALKRLVFRERRPVYVTQDKGEVPLQPRSQLEPGLSVFRRELETSGFEVRPLALGAVDEIPPDCAVLAIVRPVTEFEPVELRRIERYLNDGGKLIVALGPTATGLEAVLEKWGVGCGDGVVVERRLSGTARLDSKEPTATRFHPTHPITRVFRDASRFEVQLYAPRPLAPGGAGRGLEGLSLLDLVSSPSTGRSFYLVDRDRRGDAAAMAPTPGDFSVAVAVRQQVPDRPPAGFQRISTRLVVVAGASLFADPKLPQFSHRDFVMNSINWLVGQDELATIGGEEWVKRTLKSGREIRQFLFWAPVVVFPGVCLLIGVVVYFVRRS